MCLLFGIGGFGDVVVEAGFAVVLFVIWVILYILNIFGYLVILGILMVFWVYFGIFADFRLKYCVCAICDSLVMLD